VPTTRRRMDRSNEPVHLPLTSTRESVGISGPVRFSFFGTSVPVPHQEDSGIDLYCRLVERIGQRAWARAYYSVQVKSTMDAWVFDGSESVRWIIEHPLPIFLIWSGESQAWYT
jgi:hypothetical protein